MCLNEKQITSRIDLKFLYNVSNRAKKKCYFLSKINEKVNSDQCIGIKFGLQSYFRIRLIVYSYIWLILKNIGFFKYIATRETLLFLPL